MLERHYREDPDAFFFICLLRAISRLGTPQRQIAHRQSAGDPPDKDGPRHQPGAIPMRSASASSQAKSQGSRPQFHHQGGQFVGEFPGQEPQRSQPAGGPVAGGGVEMCSPTRGLGVAGAPCAEPGDGTVKTSPLPDVPSPPKPVVIFQRSGPSGGGRRPAGAR